MLARGTMEDRVEAIRRVVDAPRLYCVRRPIQIFERVDGEAKCVEERAHLDVLIDRVTGTRSVLQKLTDSAKIDRWHELSEASSTLALHNPLTCTRAQLPALLDRRSKYIFAFGGNQSGKSTIGAHWLWDRILETGGLYLWLSYTLEKTQVGVKALCRDNDFSRAVIPQELLVSYPVTERSGDQAIRIREGSEVSMRYCSREGDNIKGLTGVRAAVMDEGTSVDHELNFTIASARLLMAGGQMLVPTTPKKDHWLEKYDRTAMTYEQIEEEAANGRPRPDAAKVVLSIFDNVWMKEGEAERQIAAQGGMDDPRVQREFLGLWTSDGEKRWTHFDPAKHLVPWGSRDVERYGYVDLTSLVGAELFRGMTQAKAFRWIGGQDYNFRPYSLGLVRILCPINADQSDPDNWVAYVEDTVVKRAKSTAEYADWLASEAGAWKGRGLAPNAFGGLHIVGDGQGFYRNRDLRGGVRDDANEMKAAGFVVRAPKYTEKNRCPTNPPWNVRVGWMNDMLYRGKVLINAAPISGGTRNEELIDSLTTEIREKPKPNTAADRKAGITDGVGYVLYAGFYQRLKVVRPKQIAEERAAEVAAASGWT